MTVIVSCSFLLNGCSKEETNSKITATVKKAKLGSVVNVKLSEEGKEAYAGAEKYQVYDEEKARSAKSYIGEPTTVFPEVKAKEVVTVKLLNKNDEEVASVEVKLTKER